MASGDSMKFGLWDKYANRMLEKTTYTRYESIIPLPGYVEIDRIRRLEELEDPLDTNHELVRSDVADMIAEMIKKENIRDFKKLLERVMNEICSLIEYDHIHASASVRWRSMAYTYQTADEVFGTGRGICGELSLAMISVLRRLGVKASLIRPHVSHLAVIVEDNNGRHYLVDPTTMTIKELRAEEIPRFARTPKSKYIIGPITLDEFKKTTIEKRKRYGKRIKPDITAEEALDLEYARHCTTLPFNTELGRRFREYLDRIGYCKATLSELEATILADSIAECGRPEHGREPSCYARAWHEFTIIKAKMDRILRKGKEIDIEDIHELVEEIKEREKRKK